MQQEHENLQRSNDDLKQNLKHKTISLHKIQQMYDEVKKRMLQTDVQNAAADAVEDHLAAVTLDGHEHVRENVQRHTRQGPPFFEQFNPRFSEQKRYSGSDTEEPRQSNQFGGTAVYGQTWRSSGMTERDTATRNKC